MRIIPTDTDHRMVVRLRKPWIAPVLIGVLLPFTPSPVITTATFLRLRPVSSRFHEPLELSYRHGVFTDSKDSNLHFMLAFIISAVPVHL